MQSRNVSFPILAAVALGTLSACQGVVLWGNVAVFAVSVGIFVGTLALGRSRS